MRRRIDEMLRDRPQFPDLPQLGRRFNEDLQSRLDELREGFPGWASGSSPTSAWTISLPPRAMITSLSSVPQMTSSPGVPMQSAGSPMQVGISVRPGGR